MSIPAPRRYDFHQPMERGIVSAPDENVTSAQDAGHGEGHDYVKGSPHLRHDKLRKMVEDRLTAAVCMTIVRQRSCHVLEIGAGHGTFTDCLLRAGAKVTVTEASNASARMLREKFAGNDRVEVFYDETGEEMLASGRTFDAASCIAVLHHIPDYVAFVDRLTQRLRPAGWFFSVQDPLWYPRLPKRVHRSQRGAYLVWRLGQGNYGTGLKTRLRRMKGVYSETEASDLIEYHVVRDGVDEEALRSLLTPRFSTVDVFKYWSTQSPLFYRMGVRAGMASEFGILAQNRVV
jgi:SAM-dependent methyltransferase